MKTQLFERLLGCFVLHLMAVVTGGTAMALDFLRIPAVESKRAEYGLFLDIAYAGDHLVAVGERGHVVFSSDGAKTWRQAKVPVYVTLTAVHFPTASKGWAVGHDGVILRTEDGGETWDKLLDGNGVNELVLGSAMSRVEQAKRQLEQAGEPDKESAEIALEEAQFSLETAQEDAESGPVKPLLDVWFKSEQEGFVVGSYGIFLHTKDGGQSWESWANRLDNTDGFHLNALDVSPRGLIYIVGEAGAFFRSEDGNGDKWTRVETPYEGSYFGVVASENEQGGEELMIYGLRGHLFRSVDRGQNWQPIETKTQATLFGGTFLGDGLISIVGSAGTILHSRDRGQTFTSYTRPDRYSYSNVVGASGTEGLIVVGVGGVTQTGFDGTDLASK